MDLKVPPSLFLSVLLFFYLVSFCLSLSFLFFLLFCDVFSYHIFSFLSFACPGFLSVFRRLARGRTEYLYLSLYTLQEGFSLELPYEIEETLYADLQV